MLKQSRQVNYGTISTPCTIKISTTLGNQHQETRFTHEAPLSNIAAQLAHLINNHFKRPSRHAVKRLFNTPVQPFKTFDEEEKKQQDCVRWLQIILVKNNKDLLIENLYKVFELSQPKIIEAAQTFFEKVRAEALMHYVKEPTHDVTQGSYHHKA